MVRNWCIVLRRCLDDVAVEHRTSAASIAQYDLEARRLMTTVETAAHRVEAADAQLTRTTGRLHERSRLLRALHRELRALADEAATARWMYESAEAANASREAQLTSELALVRRLAAEERGVSVWPTPQTVAEVAEQLRRAELGRIAAGAAVEEAGSAELLAASGLEQLRPHIAVVDEHLTDVGRLADRLAEERRALEHLVVRVEQVGRDAARATEFSASAARVFDELRTVAQTLQRTAADAIDALATTVELAERPR